MKTVAALAGFLLTSAVAVAAHAALDEVDLVDGTVLQGRIVQQTPGSLVVIQTEDGRVQSVPWNQVKRVSAMAPPVASAYAPAPTAAPSVPQSDGPPAATAAPTPYVPPTVHLELGARLGYALAGGNYASGVSFTGADSTNGTAGINGGVPIVVDLGARIGKYVFVGAFAQYAFLSTACFTPGQGVDLSCSSHDVRAGVDMQVHLNPRGAVDPWLGIGIGHDWLTQKLTASASSASETASSTFDGWNLGDVMFGVDFRTAAGVGIGPYLEFTTGSFTNVSSSTSSTGAASQAGSTSIDQTASHQWITFGVRGTFESGARAQAD